MPIALLLLLLTGWLALPAPLAWTAVVLGIVLVSPLVNLLLQLIRKPQEVALRQHVMAAVTSATTQFAQAGLALACLPHEAYNSADAILRTTWRVLVSHRRLLEWSPFGEQMRNGAPGLLGVRAVDVDRPGAGAHDRRVPAGGAAVGAVAGGADSPAVGGSARHRVVGQPSARPTRAGTQS